MTFRRHQRRFRKSISGVRISIKRSGRSYFMLRLALSIEVLRALGVPVGESVTLEIGEGDDKGKIRLSRGPGYKLGHGGGGGRAHGACFSVANWEGLPAQKRSSVQCDWRGVAGGIEIELPAWQNGAGAPVQYQDDPRAEEAWFRYLE